MGKDKHGEFLGGNKHEPRKDLHEDAGGHPHHKQADHARHHHRQHMLHHHGNESQEEKTFIDKENRQHRTEIQRERQEDNAAIRSLNKTEKASATPDQAVSATGGKAAAPVQSSSSQPLAQRIGSIRQRIAFARSRNRQRGAAIFK